MTGPPDRIRPPRPSDSGGGARRAGFPRIIVLVVITSILLVAFAGWTAFGVYMVLIGALFALPIAVGGASVLLAFIATVMAIRRVHLTRADDTLSLRAVSSARAVFSIMPVAFLMITGGLAVYGLIRLFWFDDVLTLLFTFLVSMLQYLCFNATRRLRDGLDATLAAR